ncbi:MAG: DNA translocase FtsK 4TM domain-containing protein [Myxococcota bacterium]|nr:DNA translocase FtsK 4TM domain-containing protein [Myxococcota bacterium]
MAKTAAKKRGTRQQSESDESGWVGFAVSEISGVVLLGLAALMTLALVTYSASDPLFRIAPVSNAAGLLGANLGGGMLWLLGWGSVIGVAAMALLGVSLSIGRGFAGLGTRVWVGAFLLMLALATLPPLLDDLAPGRLGSALGGQLGDRLASLEQLLLSHWGALLLNSMLVVLGTLNVTGVSTGAALSAVGAGAAWVGERTMVLGTRMGSALAFLGRRLSVRAEGTLTRLGESWTAFGVWRERRARRSRVEELRAPALPPEPKAAEPSKEVEAQSAPEAPESATRRGAAPKDPQIVDHGEQHESKRKPEQEAFEFKEEGPSGPFQLPDTGLFESPPEGGRNFDRESLLMNSRILEKKLSDFGVMGKVVRVHPGPVITMYEYEPAPGVKVNKIVGLTDDLAMALRAISIRIIAPLPGKSVVGIEIPNPSRETVYLRTVLESDGFRKSSSELTVAMGKDIFGNSSSSDLAKMPHLLVAGSTGTGKSVFLNSFLCSLLCRATPDELKLLLVDPKLLELSIYQGIPHLIADVVTEPKRAAAALKGIVRKMEERYLMMSSVQVRNVAQFNAKAREEIEAGNKFFEIKSRSADGEEVVEEIAWATMPYIVVVIDELADLMVMAAKDVEESLQRLAQMARAAGIHLVLATQRPSVDVLTGVIKANFPSRVSFQVSSATDSRTILDQKGAENLLGLGDMLFLAPRTALVERLHGCFVSESEVVELVEFLREQGKPVFDEELVKFTRELAEGPDPGGDEEADEMFDQAVAVVAETRNASISYVQRRLKVGYNRAARMVEQMERDGMIGPQVGTRPREVFLRDPSEE